MNKRLSLIIIFLLTYLALSACGSGEVIQQNPTPSSASARITATLLSKDTGKPVTSLPELKLACLRSEGGSGAPQFVFVPAFDSASGKVVITMTFAGADIKGYEGCSVTTVNCAPASANGADQALNRHQIGTIQSGQTLELGELKLSYCH